ncbi:MAG: DUF1573 domain-containing protein [Bacteroidetes bacterium]|nr:DUF1573 domain-containing protein [Bacteroidota bacterium]MBU1484528.1 DUF1573 domain-containing protein [Bacteroidota bacterium]MBU1762130.1 DUF1573 domain-containing protein [Bacteroidota bacterium]MBU2268581.1 DUF1573 domain-containing protein [Bacteroidota bacterium]
MKIFFISAFTMIVLASCNQNQKANSTTQSETQTTEISAEAAPVMKFDKDTYDFGKIVQGEKVSYNFTFVNTGKSPLIIKDAVATCGCTVPEPPTDPIQPGQKSKINVVFSSAGKMGLQDKVVTITANTIPSQTQIHLIGEVVK